MDGLGLSIAILDDEEKLRLALARLLRSHGHDTEGFADGEALLAAVARRHFDGVLLDLFMPGLSGFDVLAALRAMSSPPPVIVITAHDDPQLVERALLLGASACRHKPIAARALLDAIDTVVRRRVAVPVSVRARADPHRH